MSAHPRRSDVATGSVRPSTGDLELWQQAARIRQEWLAVGLATQPADRATAEHQLTAVYARLGRPRPAFEWVGSPRQAMPLVGDLPTLDDLHRWVRDPLPPGRPPLAGDLAVLTSRLRWSLSESVVPTDPELVPARRGGKNDPWPLLPPRTALEQGVPLAVVLHQGVRGALHRSLAHGFAFVVRGVLARGGPMPVCWYGQQDVAWVAHYDVLRRLGLARYRPDDVAHLETWAAVARSCGWWWPGESRCVVVERPASVRTEPVPGGLHDEVRLVPGGVVHRDGWVPA